MRDMLISLQVSLEHETNTHSITSCLCHVHGGSDGTSELKLVSFDGHNLNQRKLLDELLRSLVVKAVLVGVPASTLEVHTAHKGSVFQSLFDLGGVTLREHNCVQGGLVESPALGSTSGLHESSQVGLRNVETGKPDDLRFLNLVPILVLLVAFQEVLEPVDQVLERLGCESEPLWWHEALEHAVSKVIKS